jgi:pimeloyl-ACP methyl ester carboxylesterase
MLSLRRNLVNSRVMAITILLLAVTATPAFAQTGANRQAKGETKLLTAADGWPIHVTYYASTAGKEAPVAVLIAGAEGTANKNSRTRRVWDGVAVYLQRAGYAVVTVDLRKHGDSVAPADVTNAALTKLGKNDYALMATMDLEAVKDMLVAEHKAEKLNVRKMGIVTAGSSSLVASAFAVADWGKAPYPDAPTPLAGAPDQRTPRGQDVRAVMMFSPPASVRGINTLAVMRTLKGLEVAIYVFASQATREEGRNAERIFKFVELRGEEFKDKRKLSLAKAKASGEDFLEAPYTAQTQKLIKEFLDANVKELEQPWKSRTSRIGQ